MSFTECIMALNVFSSILPTLSLFLCSPCFCCGLFSGERLARGKRSMPNWNLWASDFYGWVQELQAQAGYDTLQDLARTYWAHFPIASYLGYESGPEPVEAEEDWLTRHVAKQLNTLYNTWMMQKCKSVFNMCFKRSDFWGSRWQTSSCLRATCVSVAWCEMFSVSRHSVVLTRRP